MGSLQTYLDRDFQNFWDIRRCGKNVGLLIKCPICPWVPPSQKANEDIVWYGYRKWRATAEHIVSAHCRQLALSNRRIIAQQKRIDSRQQKKNKAA